MTRNHVETRTSRPLVAEVGIRVRLQARINVV